MFFNEKPTGFKFFFLKYHVNINLGIYNLQLTTIKPSLAASCCPHLNSELFQALQRDAMSLSGRPSCVCLSLSLGLGFGLLGGQFTDYFLHYILFMYSANCHAYLKFLFAF